MKALKKLGLFVIYYVFSGIASLFLFTIGFLWGKNRSFLYQIAAHFGPFDPNPSKIQPRISSVAFSQIASGSEPIAVLEPAAVDGNISAYELVVMNKLVKRARPKRIFEIGTFDGRTTLNLAANSLRDTIVYTLDLPKGGIEKSRISLEKDDITYIDKEVSGTRFKGTRFANKIVQLYGDSANFDWEPYVDTIDFFFVDGSHAYEYVMSDSRIALRSLRRGRGSILWHDYNSWNGVTAALNKLHKEVESFRGMQWIEGTNLVYLVRS